MSTTEASQTTAQEYAASLRAVADWFEAHPEVGIPSRPTILLHCDTKDELITAARALGRATKQGDDSWFFVQRLFGLIRVEAFTAREKVCRKVVTGTRQVPKKVMPAYEEEIVEWVCDEPILAAGEKA